jgi:MFS family permease
MSQGTLAVKPREVAFAALHHRGFRAYFTFSMLSMMGDNVEHVITYWVLYQTFQSPVLAGFAVISHWAPHLLFSVYFGALADRYDCRRIIQVSQLLFLGVSVGWGVLFLTGTLQVWHAIILLIVHGMAGAIWSPAGQLILHDMVGREHLQSAVRLNSTGRNLGILFGPGVGGVLLLVAGPALGMLLNSAMYLPLITWLTRVPYTGHGPATAERRGQLGMGLRGALATLQAVSHNRPVIAMIALGGVTSFMVGSGLQALMPGFAHDLGTDEAGLAYSALLAANAAGAVVGGVLLESVGLLQSRARTAIFLAMLWSITLGTFALVGSYAGAITLLFLMGLFNLAYSTMAQTIVQLEAPADLRGRVVGLFNMAQQGLRVGSGFTVGVLGGLIGIHWSLGISAAILLLLAFRILTYLGPRHRAAPVGLGG